jgi:hypothetical protein
MLDGGSASTDVPTLARFGAGLSKAAGGGSPGSQTASGVGVALGYEGKQVQAEIGATPVGFPYQDIVGGALQRRDHRSRGVFAGRDAPRGDRQRAVVRGRARRRRGPQVGRRDAQRRARHAELDDGTSSTYVAAGFDFYDGHHVERNFSGKGSGGARGS